MKVWIVTDYVWGGGGDDDREIRAVFAHEKNAEDYLKAKKAVDNDLSIEEWEVYD